MNRTERRLERALESPRYERIPPVERERPNLLGAAVSIIFILVALIIAVPFIRPALGELGPLLNTFGGVPRIVVEPQAPAAPAITYVTATPAPAPVPAAPAYQQAAPVVQPPAVIQQQPAPAPPVVVATAVPPPPPPPAVEGQQPQPPVVIQPVVVRQVDGDQQTFVTGSGACRAGAGARRCGP